MFRTLTRHLDPAADQEPYEVEERWALLGMTAVALLATGYFVRLLLTVDSLGSGPDNMVVRISLAALALLCGGMVAMMLLDLRHDFRRAMSRDY